MSFFDIHDSRRGSFLLSLDLLKTTQGPRAQFSDRWRSVRDRLFRPPPPVITWSTFLNDITRLFKRLRGPLAVTFSSSAADQLAVDRGPPHGCVAASIALFFTRNQQKISYDMRFYAPCICICFHGMWKNDIFCTKSVRGPYDRYL
jgi:hypothetical protein